MFSFCVTEKNEVIYSERGGLHVLPGDQVSVHDHVHCIFFTGCGTKNKPKKNKKSKVLGAIKILRLLANYCFCAVCLCHLCTSRRSPWQNPLRPEAGWQSRASAPVQTLTAASRQAKKTTSSQRTSRRVPVASRRLIIAWHQLTPVKL